MMMTFDYLFGLVLGERILKHSSTIKKKTKAFIVRKKIRDTKAGFDPRALAYQETMHSFCMQLVLYLQIIAEPIYVSTSGTFVTLKLKAFILAFYIPTLCINFLQILSVIHIPCV